MSKAREIYSLAEVQQLVIGARDALNAINELYVAGCPEGYTAKQIAKDDAATAITLFLEWHELDEEKEENP